MTGLRRSGALAGALCLLAAVPALAQDSWIVRAPLARTLEDLRSPDSRVRTRSAARLGVVGAHDTVAEPLRTAIEHEAVPEPLAVMIEALARRADATDLVAITLAWERAAAPGRAQLVGALDAIGTDEALAALRARLAAEGSGAHACDALVRTEPRVAWLASTLEDLALRDRVVSCLAGAPPSSARDAALIRAGLDLEPTRAREVLRGLARSTTTTSELVALAETALTRPDATLVAPAIDVLSRHAPERLPVASWREWLDAPDDRAASALRALLALAPEEADAALEAARGRSPEAAATALAVLLERTSATDLARIAAFVDAPPTRTAALDALSAREGGAEALAALPAAPDVDVALAIAHPTGGAREALDRHGPGRWLRALAGVRGGCEGGTPLEVAVCLALGHEAEPAARALERERDPAVVAWLALAARGAPQSATAVRALLDDEATRLHAIARVPDVATGEHDAAVRRALVSTVVRLARDDDPMIRAEAVRALGTMHRSIDRALVLGALEDEASEVRLAAALALDAVGVERGADVRVLGRVRIETDPTVRAVLEGQPPATALGPLHVRVRTHDPDAPPPVLELRLADGRCLRLPPIDGELVLPDVPDAPARITLRDGERR